MNCPNCNIEMIDGTMLCHTNDYRINDSGGNLVIIIQTHDIPSDNEEIGDSYSVKYCSCGFWEVS
tara:strand:- start:243 stop:437 length:195 start_codon:yes stop_codon:yes gene_type:complete